MKNKIALFLVSYVVFVVVWAIASVYVNYNHEMHDAYKMAIGGAAALIWASINENIVK